MKFRDFENWLKKGDLKTFSLGKTTLGKQVLACHIGQENGAQIVVQAGIHAREYVTSLLAVEQATRLQKQPLAFGVYFVLCANPDGVAVVLDGFSALPDRQREFCESKNYEHQLFKANANLVDLNTNFDALWGQGKSNLKLPHFENFVGERAESEAETRILTRFTKIVRPKLTLSYHTKGEVIYYGFDTQSEVSLQRDEKIGLALSAHLGYDLQRSFFSCGGYKDWVCDKLDVPSYTIEFGNDGLTHPLTEENLPELLNRTENMFDCAGEFIVQK